MANGNGAAMTTEQARAIVLKIEQMGELTGEIKHQEVVEIIAAALRTALEQAHQRVEELAKSDTTKCSVCDSPTEIACADCRIDLRTTVYVCPARSCRNQHEKRCPACLVLTLSAIEQAISVEFAKKAYTDDDRQHKDVLENLGVFLDHHQELEQQLTATQAEITTLQTSHIEAFPQLQLERTHMQEQLDQARQRVEKLEKSDTAQCRALQLVQYILEHDGEFDQPDAIKMECEVHGVEQLFTLKQQLTATQAELGRSRVIDRQGEG